MRALAVLASFCLLIAPAFAQDEPTLSPETAQAFTRALVDDLQAVAGEEDAEDAERVARLRAVLRENLAVAPIGRFILGSTGREMASEAELDRYDAIFPDFIATAFAAEIDELAAREIRIEDTVQRRDTEVIVQSRLISSTGRTAADVDWRVRLEAGEPRLLDVLVERVSPIVTKREEIASVLNQGGMEAVLSYMEAVIAQVSSPEPVEP